MFCRLVFFQILAHGLCFFCIKDWKANLRPTSLTADAVRQRQQTESESEHSDAPILRVQRAPLSYAAVETGAARMLVPGIIWHLYKEGDREQIS
jgi:hypothetical protein